MTLWESWNMLIEWTFIFRKRKEEFAVREIKAGEYYRHFKGGQYQVTAIARDANTEEKVVVYQALYGEEEFWVRPYEEFASEVDREKYPDAEQTWRFEKIEEPQQMNPLLLRFLEAESYRDKLELFQAWEAYADEQLLESIAVSLDITLGHGSVKEKYREILNCLKTMEHFETDRFR